MSISDRSKTDFDRAKIKLTGHLTGDLSAVILRPVVNIAYHLLTGLFWLVKSLDCAKVI